MADPHPDDLLFIRTSTLDQEKSATADLEVIAKDENYAILKAKNDR